MPNIRALFNSPIRKNFLAYIFGTGVQLLNQIMLVPFYIIYWGNNLYSDWIVLSAIVVIFGMSDIGINSVIQNRFSIKYAEGNHSECNTLLSFNFVIISIVTILALGGASIYIASTDISRNLDLHVLSRSEASIIFILLIVNIFLNMYSGIPNAIFRGMHLNSKAVLIDQIAKLLTVAITLACLLMHIPITTMCILLVAPPMMALFYKYLVTRRLFRWTLDLHIHDWKLLRTIFIQALGFLSFPIGNAILIQGFTLVVNRFLVLIRLYSTIPPEPCATSSKRCLQRFSTRHGRNSPSPLAKRIPPECRIYTINPSKCRYLAPLQSASDYSYLDLGFIRYGHMVRFHSTIA